VYKTMKSVALLLLAFYIGCSESNEPTLSSTNNYQAYDLVKSDSIGIELGDSNYVFGAILDAVYLSDGRIALLDVLQRKILVFSNTGEFISSVGREGMGPGEFISPFSLTALSNGGFAVSDVQQGKVVFFNSGLELEKEITGFSPMAPDIIRTGQGESGVGGRMSWYLDEDSDELYSGAEYCLWSDSITPDRVYQEAFFPHCSSDHVYCGMASADDGRLFTMPSSKTEYKIIGYSLSGDISFQVELPWETIFLTEDELLAARPHLIIPGPGSESTSAELSADWSPDSIRNSGYPIGIDDSNRLWVKSGRGETASPVFDLFNSEDGSYLGAIETSLPAIARFWNYRVCEQGILCWDHNPQDYPRVYILNLIDRSGE